MSPSLDMRALYLDAFGDLHLLRRPTPAREDECLVRVTLAGICGTDLELLAGYAAFSGVPGHEFVGVVEAATAGHESLVGQRVVGEINVGCGTCVWCTRGEEEHCPHRTVLGIRGRDGAFAEYLTLPPSNLHVVPAGVEDEAAVFTEPLAAACRVLDQVSIDRHTQAAVVGDGRLALLVAQVLRHAGAGVIVVGKHPAKLTVARSLGLTAVAASDAAAAFASFDVVVEASGRAAGLASAFRLIRPRGTVVLKSTFHGETAVELWPLIVNEVTTVGSRCGPFGTALDLLARGAVDVAPLVAHTLPLDRFDEAFGLARTALKVLLRPE